MTASPTSISKKNDDASVVASGPVACLSTKSLILGVICVLGILFATMNKGNSSFENISKNSMMVSGDPESDFEHEKTDYFGANFTTEADSSYDEVAEVPVEKARTIKEEHAHDDHNATKARLHQEDVLEKLMRHPAAVAKELHLGKIKIKNPPCGVAFNTRQLVAANMANNIVDFAKIVKRHEDRFITVTFASYSYRDALINWLLTADRANIRSVAIICLDDHLQEYLFQRGVPCFHAYSTTGVRIDAENMNPLRDEDDDIYNENITQLQKTRAELISELVNPTSPPAPDQLSNTKIHQLWIMRVNYLSQLLHADIDVLFSDLDAVMLQDPRPYFRQAEIVGSRGKFPYTVAGSWGSTLCMGFAYFKSTENVKGLLEEMIEITHRRSDDQVAVNQALRRSLGSNPQNVWGRSRIELMESKNAISQVEGKVKVLLFSHASLPRFCSKLKYSDWNEGVIAAHCRPSGEDKVTNRDKGSGLNRDMAMERYDIYCDTAALKGKRSNPWKVDQKYPKGFKTYLPEDTSVMDLAAETPEGHANFSTWLRTNANTCDFGNFLKNPK